jgi:hypothetical protein
MYRSYHLISVKHHRVKISKDTACASLKNSMREKKPIKIDV